MGADLICYIAFGPRQITINDRKAMRIARQVRSYLDACIKAAEKAILGDQIVPDPRKGSIKAKRSITLNLELDERPDMPKFNSAEELRSHLDYRELIQLVLADSDHDVEAQHVFAGTPESLATEVHTFVEAWNEGGFRDMSLRDDPRDRKRKVVVAGELSGGDESDGGGYQMLKKAFGLSIAQRLGVS
jgi:hypothetical protein